MPLTILDTFQAVGELAKACVMIPFSRRQQTASLGAMSALILSVFLAGCGSGGGTAPTPVPISTPTPSVLASTIPKTTYTGITTYANYDNPAAPTVNVSFPVTPLGSAAPAIPPLALANIVEYHIYRNEVVVARLAGNVATSSGDRIVFVDTGSVSPVEYQRIAADRSKLETVQSPGSAPFSERQLVSYRITLLYAPTDGSNYREFPIGISDTITLFK